MTRKLHSLEKLWSVFKIKINTNINSDLWRTQMNVTHSRAPQFVSLSSLMSSTASIVKVSGFWFRFWNRIIVVLILRVRLLLILVIYRLLFTIALEVRIQSVISLIIRRFMFLIVWLLFNRKSRSLCQYFSQLLQTPLNLRCCWNWFLDW